MKSALYRNIVILLISICLFTNTTFAIYTTEQNKLKLSTNSYIAYERNTKQVLFGKNINKKVPMASTTKIMTAIIALEYGKSNEIVTISKNAQNVVGWQLNLKQGDKIRLEELLYATMIYSANDGAIAIAEHIGGSLEKFCEMMNNKAKEIGANNTNFTSPHGLDNDNHYSTPYDLAIITDYAMNNNKFNQIVTTHAYTITINENNKTVNNTNKLINSVAGVTGVKTGYTGKAGYCLVSGIKKEKIDVISVILGANTSKLRFDETSQILKYCIDNYTIIDLKKYIKDKIEIKVNKSINNTILLLPETLNKIAILKDNENKISVKYVMLNSVKAPINKNTTLCVAQLYINGELYDLVKYNVLEKIERINNIYYFKYILFNFREFLILN